MVRFGVVGAVSLVHFRCKRLVSHAIIASDGVETNLTLIDAAIFINLLEMYHGFSRCKACFIPFTSAPADLIVNMDLTRIADGKGTVAFIIAGKCRRRTSGEADDCQKDGGSELFDAVFETGHDCATPNGDLAMTDRFDNDRETIPIAPPALQVQRRAQSNSS